MCTEFRKSHAIVSRVLRIPRPVDSAGGQHPSTPRFLAGSLVRAPAVRTTLGCAVHSKGRSTRDRLGFCRHRFDHLLQLRTVCHPRGLCDGSNRVAPDREREPRPSADRDASRPDRWWLPRLVATDCAHAPDLPRDPGRDLGSRSAGRSRSSGWHSACAPLNQRNTTGAAHERSDANEVGLLEPSSGRFPLGSVARSCRVNSIDSRPREFQTCEARS